MVKVCLTDLLLSRIVPLDSLAWQGGDDDQYCESNVDEQLLLNIAFREKVKIKVSYFLVIRTRDTDICLLPKRQSS